MGQMEKQNLKFERRKFYNNADSGKVFIITVIGQLVLSLLSSVILSQIAEANGTTVAELSSSIWYILAYSIASIVMYLCVFVFYNLYQGIDKNAISPKFKLKWHTYLIAIAIGAISLFGIQYFIGAVDNLLKLIGYPLQSSVINPTDFPTFLLATFVLALIPAIFEELIFRGIIFSGLRKRFSLVGSILLSSLLFALMHASLQQFIYPFILGSIMAWLVARTGSLVCSMIVHFTNNFLVVLISYLQNTTPFSMNLPNTWWFYLLAIGLLLITGVILYLIDKFYFKHKNEEEIEEKDEKTSIFVYMALVLGVCLLILSTIFAFTSAWQNRKNRVSYYAKL